MYGAVMWMRGPGARPASISSRRLISAYGCRLPGRAHGGNPAPQVEPRRAEGELCRPSPRGRVEEVVVQTHHPRDDRVAGKVHDLGTVRDVHRAVGAHRRDPVSADHDRLPAPRGFAGAIEQGDAGECDVFGGDGRVAFRGGVLHGPLGRKGGGEGNRNQTRASGVSNDSPQRHSVFLFSFEWCASAWHSGPAGGFAPEGWRSRSCTACACSLCWRLRPS